jgi:methylated-DNA-[protein]-cysteine S-methyltransferase
MLYQSPLGTLRISFDKDTLTEIKLCAENTVINHSTGMGNCPVSCEVTKWLDAYFAGEHPTHRNFDVSLNGTSFQKMIWQLLMEIPYGETITYGQLAERAARHMGIVRMSAQAVGQAVGANPIAIVVPCHRVVGAGGKITGYAGGIDKKIWLLRHENPGIIFRD